MPRFYKRAIFQTHVSFKSAFSATTVFVNAKNENNTQERRFGGGLYVSCVRVGVTVCVCVSCSCVCDSGCLCMSCSCGCDGVCDSGCLCVSCLCGCDSVYVTVGVVLWFQRHGQGCSMPLQPRSCLWTSSPPTGSHVHVSVCGPRCVS